MLTEAVGGKDAWEKVQKGEKGVVATCGSGMTAAVIWLAGEVVGADGVVGVYDEVSLLDFRGVKCRTDSCAEQSWTGYASRPESQVDKSG